MDIVDRELQTVRDRYYGHPFWESDFVSRVEMSEGGNWPEDQVAMNCFEGRGANIHRLFLEKGAEGVQVESGQTIATVSAEQIKFCCSIDSLRERPYDHCVLQFVLFNSVTHHAGIRRYVYAFSPDKRPDEEIPWLFDAWKEAASQCLAQCSRAGEACDSLAISFLVEADDPMHIDADINWQNIKEFSTFHTKMTVDYGERYGSRS